MHQDNDVVPDGPSCIRDVFSWVPDAIESVLFNSDLPGRDRLLFALSHGIGLGSHYSGCAGDLAWASWVRDHLVRMGLIFENDPAFVLIDCCDLLPHCRRCLKAFEPGFKHVFCDMMDRLPDDLRKEIQEIRPKAGGDSVFWEDQFFAVDALLEEAGFDLSIGLFRNGSSAYCDLHGKQCLLYGAGDDDVARCVMGVHWAGTTCLDITAFGARRGIFGPHSTIWLLWVHERRIRREPVVFTEKGPLWPLAETERALGDLYEVLFIRRCPSVFL